MNVRGLLLLGLIASLSCAPQILVQRRPQDAGRSWQPAFAGVYFETNPSPLLTWFIGRAQRAGDPFFGEQLRARPAARDAFLRAAGRGGVNRTLMDQFWRYTSADSIVVWQVWCDDGATEDEANDFQNATSNKAKETVPRGQQENYYVSVTHADGTVDRTPVDASKFSRCNLERDHFTVHVYLYDRENTLPVARFVVQRVPGLNEALAVALAESGKAFQLGGWSGWNWDVLVQNPPTPAR